jgi:hypothetical protein
VILGQGINSFQTDTLVLLFFTFVLGILGILSFRKMKAI